MTEKEKFIEVFEQLIIMGKLLGWNVEFSESDRGTPYIDFINNECDKWISIASYIESFAIVCDDFSKNYLSDNSKEIIERVLDYI